MNETPWPALLLVHALPQGVEKDGEQHGVAAPDPGRLFAQILTPASLEEAVRGWWLVSTFHTASAGRGQ